MNDGTMRILAVEDSPADFRLLGEYLTDGLSIGFTLDNAQTIREALSQLESGMYFLVLLDINLPDASGMEGLEKITRAFPLLPVIVMTGIDSEETGLLALAAQAQDYIVKGKFTGETLSRSIRYAIERKKSEEKIRLLNTELTETVLDLEKSRKAALNLMEDAIASRLEALVEKNKLEAVMEALPVGMAILDASGGNIRSNPMYEKIWGSGRPRADSVEDYVNYRAWWSDTGEPVRTEEWGSAITVRTGETVIGQQMRIARFDGTEAHVLNSAAPVIDQKGTITGCAVAIQDITAIREAEAALRRSTERFELLAGTAGELLKAKNPQEMIESLCERVMTHLDCQVFFNFLADNKSGKLRLNAYAGIPPEEGRRIEWLDYGIAVCGCAARDACRIVAERIPSTPDVRTELVKSYGVLAYACHPLFGDDGMVMGTLSFGTKTRETFSEEDLSLMKAVADQVAVAMMRMHHEHALRESREDLAHAQAVAHIGSWRLDVRLNKLSWSDENFRIFGIPKTESLTYETFLAAVHPEDREYVDRMWNAALRGEPYDIEHRIIADDVIKWIREVAELEFDQHGTLLGGFGTSQDITLRKWTEEALFQTERQFHALFDAMTEGVILSRLHYDGNGAPMDFVIISANESIERHLGMSSQNITGKRGSELFGADPPPHLEEYARVAKTGEPIRFESYFAGMDRHLSISAFSPGEERFVAVLEDISSRKIAEEEMRNTLSATTDGIWKRNPQTGEAYFSPRYYTMLGYEPDEFPASLEAWKALIHPDDIDHAMKVHTEFERGSVDVYVNEFRLRNKQGKYRFIRSRGKVVRWNENNEPMWIIGNHDDITDEREQKRLLEETGRLLSTILDNTDLMIAYLANDCTYIRVNRAYAAFHQKDISFFPGKQLSGFVPIEGLMTVFQEVVSTGKPLYEKARVIAGKSTPADSIRYWDWSLIPVIHPNDSIRGVVLTLVDVTEHKEIEEELINFNERLEILVRERTVELSIINSSLRDEINRRMLLEREKDRAYRELDVIFNSMTVGMTVVDRDFNFLRVNRRFLEMFSLLDSDVINRKCCDFWHGNLCGTENCPMNGILSGMDSVEYELRQTDESGHELIFQIDATPFFSETGEVAGLIHNVIDITEKRDIQRKLISVIDEERKKISYELHDGLGQDLTAIGFILESVRQKLDISDSSVLARLEEIGGIIQYTQNRTRSISRLLSPVDMEHGGFLSSISELGAYFEHIYEIRCIVSAEGNVFIDDNNVATNLYYVIREGINNAIKHANPKTVFVRMIMSGNGLNISVSDDGTAYGDSTSGEGMGLKIMKHRTEIAGATLMTTRSDSGGFELRIHLPHP